ncbi:MAG: hypothetical protein EA402_04950 [Planctomycetota bacterium]|nr:MAG: hypothetical protein EA402_04950 [Planctomycetota bacterium]
MQHSPSQTRPSLSRRRHWLIALGALFAFTFAGCASVEDTLTIHADGSWSVELEVGSPMSQHQRQQALMAAGHLRRGETLPIYPPLTPQEARNLFPDQAVQISPQPPKHSEANLKARFVIRGEQLSQLLDSPYAQQRQLRLEATEAGTELSYTDPMQTIIGLLAIDPEAEQDQHMSWYSELLEGAIKHRQHWRSTQRVILPGGQSPDAWASSADGVLSWELAGNAEDGSFDKDRFLMPRRARGDALEVEIPSPTTRLGQGAFADLPTGLAGGSAQAVDEEGLKAQARWLPQRLEVTRSFNYSGERQHRRDGTQFHALLLLPPQLEPSSWGELTINQALANDGSDVTVADRNFSRGHSSYFGGGRNRGPLENFAYHQYHSSFGVVPRGADGLSSIEVEATLTFPGAPHVVKAEHLIPADEILEANHSAGRSWSSQDRVAFPGLDDYGIGLRYLRAERQQTGYQIEARLADSNGRIIGLQVFDAEGRPWPSMVNPYQHSSSTLYYITLGHPQPPLSIALMVDGGGAKITLSHTFTDLPLRPVAASEESED